MNYYPMYSIGFEDYTICYEAGIKRKRNIFIQPKSEISVAGLIRNDYIIL